MANYVDGSSCRCIGTTSNARVMNDERMKALMDPAGEIADYKRMVCGGFEVIVDL